MMNNKRISQFLEKRHILYIFFNFVYNYLDVILEKQHKTESFSASLLTRLYPNKQQNQGKRQYSQIIHLPN